jgi:RNase P protein component
MFVGKKRNKLSKPSTFLQSNVKGKSHHELLFVVYDYLLHKDHKRTAVFISMQRKAF